MTAYPSMIRSSLWRRRTGAVAVIASMAALSAGCTESATVGSRIVHEVAGADLVAFDSCRELLSHYRAQGTSALRRRAPFLAGTAPDGGATEVSAASATGAPGAVRSATASADSFSGTNNQEEGVDEADRVKSDGRVIISVRGARVHVTDAAAGREIATIAIPKAGQGSTSELLLSGHTLLILTSQYAGYAAFEPSADSGYALPDSAMRTIVTRVDLSDPASPKILGAVRIEGSYRSARMVGEAVRMVMVSHPTGLRFRYPTDGSLATEREVEKYNKAVIANSTLDAWIPHIETLEASGDASGSKRLVDCTSISRPPEDAGLNTLSVITFDVGTGSGDPEERIAPTSTVGLLGTGSTVYASTDRLIVATSPWELWDAGIARPSGETSASTGLHVFDISDPDTTRYTGSGAVPGRLINQFALDEEDGVIRVATTTGSGWRDGSSQSSLVVLKEKAGVLTKVGQVDGMGKTEQIHSVRFLSADLAAIVTFRQTDPLYLVDTSEPTAPRVAGELKIPGFSAYLHPVGDGRLLGVGQDADPRTGRTTGLQVSLFDISDPSAPTQLDKVKWTNSYSPVQADHRAFLWWQGKAYVPAHGGMSTGTDGAGGIVSLDVADRGLTEGPTASMAGGDYIMGIDRLFVIGDDLWALSWQGLERFDLRTLQHETSVPLSD